jgi:phosphate transport system substrate-binding protein
MSVVTIAICRLRSVRAYQLLPLLMLLGLVGMYPKPALGQNAVTVVGSGGTSPLPVYRGWAAEFNRRRTTTRMEYLVLDTSRSIAEIQKGSGDFGGGDTPLSLEDRSVGNLIELPALLIALVPIYNLPGTPDLHFSGELLADIYLGHVKKWNAPQIAQLNPHASLPDLPIKVVYRTPGKGTNYIFTDFLSKVSPQFREKIGRSVSPAWPVGTGTERSSDMAQKVMSEPGSIGFVELEYARENKIPFGDIRNAAGKFVKASPDSLAAACSSVEAPKWDKFASSLTNAPGAESYPIVSFTWLYLRTATPDPNRKAALFDLLHWMLTEGQQMMPSGYSPLPLELRAKELAKLDSLK